MNRLIGYVWKMELEKMPEQDIKDLDCINIAFGHVEEGRVRWEHPECMAGFERIRRINPQIKIVLSIGGWSAGGFSEAAFTQEGREQFAKDCCRLICTYGLDGIDIDWEYPCFSLAGIGACKEDKENFTLLLKTIREHLEEMEKGRYLLSIAAGGDSYFVRNTRMDQAQQYLDYVQLMNYDLRGGFQLVTGHHTNLYTPQTDLFDVSVDKAVEAFHGAGVPYEKLVIGAAFYSREWEGVADVDHGYCQPAKAPAAGHHYGELADGFINKNGYTRYWDDEAKAPWLFNGNRFISYDDEESLSCKIGYLKEKGLLGIMFWAYGGDQPYSLLGHMRKELDR